VLVTTEVPFVGSAASDLSQALVVATSSRLSRGFAKASLLNGGLVVGGSAGSPVFLSVSRPSKLLDTEFSSKSCVPRELICPLRVFSGSRPSLGIELRTSRLSVASGELVGTGVVRGVSQLSGTTKEIWGSERVKCELGSALLIFRSRMVK
jgi:hypothetical protein